MPTTPNADIGSSVDVAKLLLAARLNKEVRKFFKDWNEGNLKLDKFEEKTDFWFLANAQAREGFLVLAGRSRKHEKGLPTAEGLVNVDILYGPGATRFKLLYRTYLFDNFSTMFKDQHEAISMLAWLVGPEDENVTPRRLPNAREAFRR